MISPLCGAILIVCGSSNEKKPFPAALAVVLTAHEQQNNAKEEWLLVITWCRQISQKELGIHHLYIINMASLSLNTFEELSIDSANDNDMAGWLG